MRIKKRFQFLICFALKLFYIEFIRGFKKMASRALGSLETWSPDDNSFTKHTLKSGEGDLTPNDGSVCIVYLNLIDHSNVPELALGDYKLDRECEVIIGEGDTTLSELLDKIVMSMKIGEQSYVKCNVDKDGNKIDKFQPESDRLKWKILLKSFNRAADPSELLSDEKLERAEHHKNQGTSIYRSNMKFSLQRFAKALFYLDSIDAKCLSGFQLKQLRTLQKQCHLNIAAGNLKDQNYDVVIEHCTAALDIEPKDIKGLFRRAQAYLKLQQYEEAKIDLLEALKLEENNKAIISELHSIDNLIMKERQMYQKMFT